MIIIGNWLKRVDTVEGRAKFKGTYDVDYFEYMIEHQVTHITRLFAPKTAHVVILEYDGSMNQIFSLSSQEHLEVHSHSSVSDKRVFNTDGMAFMRLIRDCEVKGTFCLENSPFDMEEDDWQYMEYSKEKVFEKLNALLSDRNAEFTATEDNTIFVRQL